MLDQSFSAYHFNEIFQIERRKGNIRKDYFPKSYMCVLEDGHRLNDIIRSLKKKKKKEWTSEETKLYNDTKELYKENLKKRREEESKWLETIADTVNKKDFKITLSTVDLDGKIGYTVPDSVEYMFVMKTLQHNLKKVFKVQQANRHRIMTQVKRLMNENTPKYIIRTDVHHFYESIPQDRLLEMIKGNTLLSKTSVRFIWQILAEYERDKSREEPNGKGIPRGVGVSAYLSEIYMRDLDEKIKHRSEIVYYVRYVDDIFIILSHLPANTSLAQYYDGIRNEFAAFGLLLMDPKDDEQKGKLQLLDFFTSLNRGDKEQEGSFTYLGYELHWKRSLCNSGTILNTSFGMSKNKLTKIKMRIDAAFAHFLMKTKYSLGEARKDLRDSLRFIAGNYRLTKSKSGIKAGIYYSNDLLTNPDELDCLTNYLHGKDVDIYPEVLKVVPERDKYIKSVENLRDSFDFATQWREHKSYSLSDKRIREISQWL